MNSNVSQDLVMDTSNHKTQLWSVYYVCTLAVSLVINISGFILITLLPLFTLSIGGNNFMAGFLTTLLATSSVVFRPIFGKMLDIKGRRMVLILGLFLFSTSTIMLVAATNIPLLLTLRLLQGIGLSAYSTALGTILSDIVPAQRLSEGVGYFGISGTIAMAVGPALGLYLCDRFGYQVTYIIAFCIALSSIAFASFIKYERKTKTSIATSETAIMPKTQQKKGIIEKSSIKPCLVMFFSVVAISAVFSFMPLFSEERGIDNIGLFFTFYAVSVILTRLFTGKVADRFGYSKVFYPAIILTLMLFLTLAFAYSLPLVLLAAVFYGVGYGSVQPILNAIVIKLSPPERRGAANATYYMTMDIGFGIGSFAWGAISQIAGFTAVFLSGAVCIAISAIAFYFMLNPLLKENESQ